MAIFGAGTVPMMLTLSLAGKLMPVWLRLRLRKAIPVCVGLVGALLILRGMSLGIPYLSPDMSSGAPSCCQPPTLPDRSGNDAAPGLDTAGSRR
jgi:hypothetical protein